MKRFRLQKKAVRFLEPVFRTWLTRLRFLEKQKSVLKLQKLWRRYKFWKRVKFAQMVRGMVKSHYNKVVWPTILDKLQNEAAVKIQSVWHGYKYRRDHPKVVRRIKEAGQNYKILKLALYLQRIYRGNIVRKKLAKLRKATVKLQCAWKRSVMRRWFVSLRKSTLQLQRWWRDYSLRFLVYKPVLLEQIQRGEVFNFDEMSRKENSEIFETNFVKDVKVSERERKFAKKKCKITCVPECKKYALSKIKFWSYILDIDLIADPADSYAATWATHIIQ
jgi:hypothetical protein